MKVADITPTPRDPYAQQTDRIRALTGLLSVATVGDEPTANKDQVVQLRATILTALSELVAPVELRLSTDQAQQVVTGQPVKSEAPVEG